MNSKNISYNDYTLFHMLRHFEYINDQARQCLLKRGYTNQNIDENLSIPGSKFHRSFATDIKSLVEKFPSNVMMGFNQHGKYFEGTNHYNLQDFPGGIGTRAIVHLNDIEHNAETTICQKQNRGYLLKHAIVKTIPNEWQLTIVVKPQKNYDLLITAFPGLPTLPLPKHGMKKEFIERSVTYWQEHCFLELIQ